MRPHAKSIKILTVLSFLILLNGYSEDSHHLKPYEGSKEFKMLKKLAGSWEGIHKMRGEEHKVTVEYDLSSAGSALIEKLFIDTPHEMVSVYHERDGKLQMTHYCALGNQPHLLLAKSGEKSLEFEFGGYNDVDPSKDGHIHGLKVTFEDDNHITQNWTMFENGKEKDTTIVVLTRVQ